MTDEDTDKVLAQRAERIAALESERDSLRMGSLAHMDQLARQAGRIDELEAECDRLQALVDGALGPRSPAAASLASLVERVAKGRAKFPGNRFMLPALMEEVGELARALLQRKGPEEVRAEALDTAAVALRIFEEGDATFDDISDEESKP